MHSTTAVALVCVWCVVVVCGRPNQAHGEESSLTSASTSQSTSSSNFCEVNFSQIEVNGNCSSKLTIDGDGIHKDIEYKCQDKPKPVIISIDHSCLIGDEFFIEKSGELVRMTGNTCTKEVFHEQDGKWTSELVPMTKEECDDVKEKVVQLKNQQQQVNYWYEQQQNQMHQGLMAMHNQLEELMANMAKPFVFN